MTLKKSILKFIIYTGIVFLSFKLLEIKSNKDELSIPLTNDSMLGISVQIVGTYFIFSKIFKKILGL